MAKRGPKGGAAKRKKKKKAGASIPAVEADVGTKDFLARSRVDIITKDVQDLNTAARRSDEQAAKLDREAAEMVKRVEKKRAKAQKERERAADKRQKAVAKKKELEQAKIALSNHEQWLNRKPLTRYYFGGKQIHEDNFPVSSFLAFSSYQDIGRVSQTHRVLRNCYKETIVRRIAAERNYPRHIKHPAVLVEHENHLMVLKKLDRQNLIYRNLGPQQYKQIVGHRNHIAGGDGFSLFLSNQGAIRSCGRNWDGQLGFGDRVTRHLPVAIPSLSQHHIVTVATGNAHSVAITRLGLGFTWGCSENGQLGHGCTSNESHPRLITSIRHTNRIVGAACGDCHTLLLTDNGQVLSCGFNASSQLGLGDTSARNTPCLIDTLVGTFVLQVTAGTFSSGALSAEGKCFTWGHGCKYGLGLGTSGMQTKPKVVEVLTKYTITQLALGYCHGLALDDKHHVYSWGSGNYGQHGQGHNDAQKIPKQIEYLIENKYKVKKIHCNWNQSIILLKKNGKVLTFGEGAHGKLGHGDEANQNTPKVISSLDDTKISEFHFSDNHLLLLSESADGSGKILSCGHGGDEEGYDDDEVIPEEVGGLGHSTIENQLLPKNIEALAPFESEFVF